MFSLDLPNNIQRDPGSLRNVVLQHYKGPDFQRPSFKHSFFGRNPEVTARLDEIIPRLPDDPHILFIGLGVCKYGTGTVGGGAIELAGMLEGHGKRNFQMTILDVEADLVSRFVAQEVVKTREDPSELNADLIRQYARRTGAAVEVRGSELVAPISPLFRAKLRDGDVKVLQGELLESHLETLGPFHLIHCLNVLTHLDTGDYVKNDNPYAPYLYPDNDRRLLLALYNLVGAMRVGGSLIVDQTEQGGEAYEHWCFPSSRIVKDIVSAYFPSHEQWRSDVRSGLVCHSIVEIVRGSQSIGG